MKGWLKKTAAGLMALLMVVTFMPAGIFTAYADEGEPEKVPVTKVEIKRVSQGVLKAEVTGKDGKTPTDVKFQWQKCTEWYQGEYEEEPEVEYENISGETKDTLKVTKDNKSRYSQYKVIVTDCDNKKHYTTEPCGIIK